MSYPSGEPVRDIMKLLKQFKRPLGIYEIAFHTNCFESVVTSILARLLKANVVYKEGDGYRINPPEKYELAKMYK